MSFARSRVAVLPVVRRLNWCESKRLEIDFVSLMSEVHKLSSKAQQC